MSTKGVKQGKKFTANTVALKARVRGGTQESRQILFLKKGMELLTGLVSF